MATAVRYNLRSRSDGVVSASSTSPLNTFRRVGPSFDPGTLAFLLWTLRTLAGEEQGEGISQPATPQSQGINVVRTSHNL